MDAWEVALTKLNQLVSDKKLKTSVPSKQGMRFFECSSGQFAIEEPRGTRKVKGAKFWFSFPPKVPDGVFVERKGPGEGRNNKLNTTQGSRMGVGAECWSVLIANSSSKVHEDIYAILSGLNISLTSRDPHAEAPNIIQSSGLTVENVETRTPVSESSVSRIDLKDPYVGDEIDFNSEKLGSQGYEQDPVMRRVVEQHAVLLAKGFYLDQGYAVKELGKPFDLLCEKDGELIHVEVKGSRSKLDAVILTINEVADAENTDWQSDLFIVDQVVIEKVGDELLASDGVARVIQKWVPAKEMLAPSQFKYRLPDENQWTFLN